MTRHAPRPRRAFSLIEMMVVIAIIAVLVALIIPAVQKVRAIANRTKAQNALKNIAIAAVHAHEQRKMLPPNFGRYGQREGSALFHLLPYLEEDSTYNDDPAKEPFRHKVGIFLSPTDNTAGEGAVAVSGDAAPWGAASFAFNGLCGRLRMPDNFSDGTSKTLLFTEKIASCDGAVAGAPYLGGNAWAWVPKTPGPSVPPYPYHAPVVLTANPYTGRALDSAEPQFQPKPDQCDPFRASTPNLDVINVAFADGSVRNFSNNIAASASKTEVLNANPKRNYTVWWTLLTPSGRDNKGEDQDY